MSAEHYFVCKITRTSGRWWCVIVREKRETAAHTHEHIKTTNNRNNNNNDNGNNTFARIRKRQLELIRENIMS